MCNVSEEDVRRLAETAHTLGLKINDEARKVVEEGKSPEFYLGFVSGIACVITISRNFLENLSGAVKSDPRQSDESRANVCAVAEAVELITMRAAGPAAVAAESYLKNSKAG